MATRRQHLCGLDALRSPRSPSKVPAACFFFLFFSFFIINRRPVTPHPEATDEHSSLNCSRLTCSLLFVIQAAGLGDGC